jgi:putative ABC transport system substrate-binding protein
MGVEPTLSPYQSTVPSRYDAVCKARGNMLRRKFLGLVGGAAVWPLSARAQQSASPVIGFLSSRSPEDSVNVLDAFRRGLRESGFVDGYNVTLEFRWARGQYQHLPEMAADLVNRRVNVLAAVGGEPSARAAKQATSTIPIVFVMGDPVKAGLVKSFNRPDGNATGSVPRSTDVEPKRLSLLLELVPNMTLIGVLLDPDFPTASNQLHDLEQAARTMDRRLFVARARNDAELNAAFSSLLQQQISALHVTASPYFDSRRERIIAFAEQNRLPADYPSRDYAVAGGLVSYGPSFTEAYRNAGVYVGRIIKGEKVADLPVVQSTKFDFVINISTAKVLGLTLPPMLLARADEVVE